MPRFSVATPAARCTLCARHPAQQRGRAEVSATSSQASGAASDGLFARRLAVIAFIDVVGYSALMSRDEDRTHARWRTLRREVIEPRLEAHRGALVKSTGDGVLVEFSSVLNAVGWSRDVQAAVREAGEAASGESLPQLELRIAVHLCDVIEEAEDLYGDGVNIAARLQAFAPPGGIVLTETAYDIARGSIQPQRRPHRSCCGARRPWHRPAGSGARRGRAGPVRAPSDGRWRRPRCRPGRAAAWRTKPAPGRAAARAAL